MPGIPRDRVAALVQITSFLTSSLEELALKCGQGREALLEDALSSFICRCGSSLRRFDFDVPFSEAAIHHLMQLPNLRSGLLFTNRPKRFRLPLFRPSKSSFPNRRRCRGSTFLRCTKRISFRTVSLQRCRTQASERR
jgi:hypothetical protein